jgi:hypothetical protein
MPNTYQLPCGFILDVPTLIEVPKLAKESSNLSDLPESPRQPGAANAARELANLATELRGTMTPVVGYLELISDEHHSVPSEQHLRWIATVERRLEAMRELSDQVTRICEVLRESIDGRESVNGRPEAPRRGPSTPAG